MPLIFTRDQIRAYLHGQGYAVNESELDAFIHDLKRVVKHEDRKRRRKRLGHEPDDTRLDTTYSTTTTSSPDEGEYYLFEDFEEEDEGVHSSAESPSEYEEITGNSEELASQSVKLVTKPSRTKSYTSPKENIRVEKSPQKKHSMPDLKRADKIEKTPACKASYIVMDRRTMTWNENNEPVVVDSKVPIPIDVPDKQSKEKKKKSIPLSNTSNIIRKKVEITPPNKSNSPKDKENITSASAHSLPKSRSSGSTSTPNTDELLELLENLLPEPEDTDSDSDYAQKRPIGPPDHIKRDPVALYHYYKSFWDKQKLPGHNRHMKLRWNVRAQTVGTYPCMNGQPIKYLRQ